MDVRFVRCRHCGLPHEAAAASCPFTGKPIDPATRLPETATAAAQDVPPLCGQLVDGRYRVVELLGKGAMGAVYRAEHVMLRKDVAIKVLLRRHAPDSEGGRRFVREARIAGQIGHPNVIELFDVGLLDDGSPYLVMELLSGESLADKLERVRTLGIRDAIEMGTQLLAGLAEAHDRGVVHRDVKPDNLFLTGDPAAPRLKIVDFGIGKILDDTGAMTRAGDVLGTPHYLAPEQAAGDVTLDGRVDLWAAGVVLYEALTGQMPFDGDSIPSLVRAILVDPPPRPSKLRFDLPGDLEEVILRALAKDREARFAHAGEMLAALTAVGTRLTLMGARLSDLSDTMRTFVSPSDTDMNAVDMEDTWAEMPAMELPTKKS